MLNVLFTTDVEVWCDGWEDLDAKFPEAMQRDIYGVTANGHYGIPLQLELLQDHGLTGVFFVEPLFATRFGEQPLSEIIGLINEGKQEVQLHMHTEWVDESLTPIIPDSSRKRQHMHCFTLEEQDSLISKGLSLLHNNGCDRVDAFRAGNFAANFDTLKALRRNGVAIDSSYNFTAPHCKVLDGGETRYHPYITYGLHEYPVSLFSDYPGHHRHAQLTACSFKELQAMLYQAVDKQWNSFVILSHGFELLDRGENKVNKVVYDRFVQLCKFLGDNRDIFNSVGFADIELFASNESPPLLKSRLLRTAQRMFEQVRG